VSVAIVVILLLADAALTVSFHNYFLSPYEKSAVTLKTSRRSPTVFSSGCVCHLNMFNPTLHDTFI
jgi:hypothetical protein